MALNRSYYDDGALRYEGELLDGVLPHGVHREWHPNGTLAKETPYNMGIIDGVVKQWDENGELLLQSDIPQGTGVLRTWHADQGFFGEISFVDGKMTGRQHCYFQLGESGAQQYWLENKRVSRKRYLKACEKNSKLPRYDDELPKEKKHLTKRRQSEPSNSSIRSSQDLDELPLGLLQGKDVKEALSWLADTRELSRSLGEATDQAESIRLVKKLYRLGAVSVHAVEIDGGPDEDQNSGKVVIELPDVQEQRAKLLKLCGKLARDLGFEADSDVGQKYLLLMLD